MRVGYAKLGRSILLDKKKWGAVGGDNEPLYTLLTLADAHPEVEWVIIGRNSGEDPSALGLPKNIINPWYTEGWAVEFREWLNASGLNHPNLNIEECQRVVAKYDEMTLAMFAEFDGLVIWAGQHGTSNTPIPKVGSGWEELTCPQDSFIYYAGYIIRGVNMFRARDPHKYEEIWLHADARNYVKARDLKWPTLHPMLGQYNFTRNEKHERYTDRRSPAECGFPEAVTEGDHVWIHPQRYMYSRLEICGILPEHSEAGVYEETWSERKRFGLFINEARAGVKLNRKDAVRDWVLRQEPDFIHGKWSKESMQMLGREITVAPWEDYYPTLRSVKSTFTTPSSGSGWATTKPWEAFGAGTVCFFHPNYDDQGHIIPTLEQVKRGEVESETMKQLALWLRVETPEQLTKRIDAVHTSEEAYRWLASTQRKYYDWACHTRTHLRLMEARLGL